MDATKTSPPSKLADLFRACVSLYVARGSRVCIGLSGGVDSVVLLHLFTQLRTEYRLDLTAIHIHHGISPHADAWALACAQRCIELEVPLRIHKVDINDRAKMGLEAAARQARYTQFQHQNVDFIALAHHRDDQAETVLLQLLRGAGVKGLAAMPALRQLANQPAYLRPLLDTDRSAIIAWAQHYQLNWIEDESNQDTQFSRNFLRHKIFPLISQQHPAWRATIARSAQHMAEAATLLDELAELDARHGIHDRRIDCAYLASISPARARNLLRYFLARRQLAMPSQIGLAEMLCQLTRTDNDNRVAIDHDGLTLHRYQQYGYLIKSVPAPAAGSRWHWHGEAQLNLPELAGTLYFKPGMGSGLDPGKLQNVQIRLRQGGESFRPDCNRPNRRLKTLLQSAHMPPWQRDRIPLIYSGDKLIQVPGVGIACGWQAGPGQAAIHIEWHPDS